MGKIFCIMGKSGAGKDSIYSRLLERSELDLHPVVSYTTRPIRKGEKDGREYFFCDRKKRDALAAEGKVIESRTYHTWHGEWDYFTVEDGQIDLSVGDYLVIGTPESYRKLSDYYKKSNVLPIYIEVEDGIRLQRAVERERRQRHPKYEELCRRFLADNADFAPEKLKDAGVSKIFYNEKIEETTEEVASYITGILRGQDQEGSHGSNSSE